MYIYIYAYMDIYIHKEIYICICICMYVYYIYTYTYTYVTWIIYIIYSLHIVWITSCTHYMHYKNIYIYIFKHIHIPMHRIYCIPHIPHTTGCLLRTTNTLSLLSEHGRPDIIDQIIELLRCAVAKERLRPTSG